MWAVRPVRMDGECEKLLGKKSSLNDGGKETGNTFAITDKEKETDNNFAMTDSEKKTETRQYDENNENKKKAESFLEASGLVLLCEPDFHLILWGYVLGSSVQVMYMTNLSTIGTSLSLGTLDDTMLIVSPVFAMCFALYCGWLSDITMKLFPRCVYVMVCLGLQVILFGLSIEFGEVGGVFGLTTMIVYGNSGVLFAIVANMIHELFPTKHFKRNWGILLMCQSFVTFGMMKWFGILYSGESALNTVSGNSLCKGLVCLFKIYIVCTVFSLCSFVCFVIVFIRWIV